jgi:hypothetical protein
MSSKFALFPLKDFSLTIEIDAPIEKVWSEMVDWEGQSKWMLATRVYDEKSSPVGINHRLKAFTGLFAKKSTLFGVMDEMYVSAWEPPRFCRVEHIGKVIKGYGTFTLTSLSTNRTRFDWFEEIKAPAPILIIIKIPTLIGVAISLRRFKKIAESKVV